MNVKLILGITSYIAFMSKVPFYAESGSYTGHWSTASPPSPDGGSMDIVSPHTLRHLHAVAALDSNVPLNDLQQQLGHTDLKTTSIYLKADINHRRKSYEGFDLLSREKS